MMERGVCLLLKVSCLSVQCAYSRGECQSPTGNDAKNVDISGLHLASL